MQAIYNHCTCLRTDVIRIGQTQNRAASTCEHDFQLWILMIESANSCVDSQQGYGKTYTKKY